MAVVTANGRAIVGHHRHGPVHILDRVMFSVPEGSLEEAGHLVEEVARDGQHAIFSTFLYETGIGNVLAEDKDHFTVFVPTDRRVVLPLSISMSSEK